MGRHLRKKKFKCVCAWCEVGVYLYVCLVCVSVHAYLCACMCVCSWVCVCECVSECMPGSTLSKPKDLNAYRFSSFEESLDLYRSIYPCVKDPFMCRGPQRRKQLGHTTSCGNYELLFVSSWEQVVWNMSLWEEMCVRHVFGRWRVCATWVRESKLCETWVCEKKCVWDMSLGDGVCVRHEFVRKKFVRKKVCETCVREKQCACEMRSWEAMCVRVRETKCVWDMSSWHTVARFHWRKMWCEKKHLMNSRLSHTPSLTNRFSHCTNSFICNKVRNT